MSLLKFRAIALLAAAGAVPLAAGCAVDSSPDASESGHEALAAGGAIGATPVASATVVSPGPIAPPPLPALPTPLIAPLDQGVGWQHVTVSGQAIDGASGAAKSVAGEYYVIHGRAAIAGSGLPLAAKNQLVAQFAAAPAAAAGDDELIILPRSAVDAATANAAAAASGQMKAESFCSDSEETFTKDYWTDQTYGTTKTTDPNGFTGSAVLGASIDARVFATVNYTAKRHWYFGCIPYPVIHSVGVQAAGSITANGKVDATFSKSFSWSTTIAQPEIGTVTLPVIPIPITFSIPIRVGIDADAKAELHSDGTYSALAGFNLTCTSSGCTGSHEGAGHYTGNTIPSANVTATAHATPWIEAGLHAKVLSDYVAYGEGVVRASLPTELFGYAGNTCGDANGDGVNEFVSGVSVDMKVALDVRAKAGFVTNNYGPWSWNVYNDHLGFWKIYDGGVFSPMFTVKNANFLTATMQASMRPCFPYADTATYQIAWGDGTTSPTFTSGEHVPVLQSHAFAGYGTHSGLQLTAISDSAGRSLNTTATSSVYLRPFVLGPIGGGVLQVAN